jgi:citrate lyase subunit beta/citryl-CoA lyase
MRSLLFVPGDSARKLDKAMGAGADALLVDLEDSVAAGGKEAARRIAAGFLSEAARAESRPRLLVRINPLASGLADADLAAVMAAGPDGILLPKAEGGHDIAHLGAKLAVHEAEYGLGDGVTPIIALAAESARGVLALPTLAGSSPRLRGITWGGEDLSAEIGAEANRDQSGRFYEPYRLVRALTLIAAAAAEVDAIDTVYTNFRDPEGLAADCHEARRDGFVAKLAIHPAQVPVINDSFTPTVEAVSRARAVVDAFAADTGTGVVGLDGEMLDRPHLLRAQRLLARAEAVRRSSGA